MTAHCNDFREKIDAGEPMKQCTKLNGYYNVTDKFCYYNGSQNNIVCRYLINGKCYPYVHSSYTRSSCTNIGGSFATSSTLGESGTFCYFMQFNCTFHAVNGQCYRFWSAVDHQTECDSIGGYYLHGYCYYECPANKFLINDQCYFNRSAEYIQSDCEAVGGLYIENYCYLKECNYTMVNNKCYKYRSADYSNDTCINIGGYYTAEAVYPYRPHCYYTTFNCRYHSVNGQCYSRSSNQSQTVCKTISQSYYDVTNSICYYYCTEMPNLGRCIVGVNSSFTTQMCELIGGIYSNRACYYITSHCPLLKANNGHCYTNRSVALTCNTCDNIGGHFENGFCYYYQNNCTAYSIDGQCYSRRSSRYSADACFNNDGLFRDGYCYYEASKCSDAFYKNCMCFRSRSSSKSAGTCANIGGYFDLGVLQCSYNSSACPYYIKMSQCYRYRSTNFSRETCSFVSGYYSYERDADRQYRYTCYFNEFNCSNWKDNRCYLRFASSYNEVTCASIGGYYSRDDRGCYYNSSTCRYWTGGQCYDKRYSGWSKDQCDDVNGYHNSYFGYCYMSNYYCPYVVTARKRCYLYTSASYDCNSCRLLDGHFESGRCLYSQNCSQPLFLSSNGQCYRNQTTVRTAADCSVISGYSFYDGSAAKCYFTPGICSSGMHKVDCQCFMHSSSVYTNGSCSNFGGQYFNRTCYYNTSYCPHYSVNGQCYRQNKSYDSQQLCRNIGGHYVFSPPESSTFSSTLPAVRTAGSNLSAMPFTSADIASTSTTSPSITVGTCYYNTYNCSGFIVDQHHCYMNRSATFSRTTCTNIGGVYAYRYDGRQYRSVGRTIYSWRTYYCLYNAFNCAG